MSDPRRARLESDAARLRRLAAESGGTIAVEAADGNPPLRWVVRLRCRGVASLEGGRPQLADEHRVEVRLGAAYPLRAPEVTFLTPIAHPHVWTHRALCTGKATGMTEGLDELVLRIGGIIQWDPALLDPRSPADRTALQFALANPGLVPFGRESFRRARPSPAAALLWSDRR